MNSSLNAVVGSNPSDRQAATGWRLANVAWIALVLFLTGYGMFTFQAGTLLMPGLSDNNPQKRVQIERVMAAADHDPSAINQQDIDQSMPLWMRVVASNSSDEYTYSSDSVAEVEAHYQGMSAPKRTVLSTHMMLGLVIMATGALQFWPAFRRKHRKLHRISGAAFIAAAFGSMSMSGYHLITTPVEHIYTQFIFATGLWFALVWSIGSIFVSIWALAKKKYALHVGFMASAFAMYLTAPIQRSMWVGLAPFGEGRTFNEMNMAVTSSLFGLCFLLGYGLFYVNRASSPLRKQIPQAPESKYGRLSIWLSAIAAITCTLLFFGIQNGLGQANYAAALLIPSAIEWHDQIFADARPLLLCLSLSILIAGCAMGLSAPREKLASMRKLHGLVVISGLASCAILMSWGIELGLPSKTVIMGGTLYWFASVLILLFLAAYAWRSLARNDSSDRIAEMLWFVFAFAMAPAMFYLSMHIIAATSFIPQAYYVSGDGYQLAVAVGLTLPPLIGLLAAIFSNETRKYAMN